MERAARFIQAREGEVEVEKRRGWCRDAKWVDDVAAQVGN